MNGNSDAETMTVAPRAIVPTVKPRTLLAALVVVIALLLGAIWYEIWSYNNLVRDAQCVSLEYDYDGERKESLNAVEQMQNDIFGCGLDLPTSEDTGDSGF
jgi:hypothetical protein